MAEYQPRIQKEVVQALGEFVTIETLPGLKLYVREYALLLIGLGMALFLDNLVLRLLGSLLAGFKIGSLYTLSHDASHYSLVRPRWLNRVLGTFGFMPALLNYRLWQYDHVIQHHPKTNGPQRDIHRPMSFEAYRNAPRWRQAWERFARAWNPLARMPYFIVGSRWLEEKLVPNRKVHPADVRREAWPAALLLIAYVLALLGWFYLRRAGEPGPVLLDLLFGFLLPVGIFQTSACIVTGIQHLHPDVPWFAEGDPRFAEQGQEAVTLNWRVPLVVGRLMHFSLDHVAHHMVPAIPSRRLREAQDRLNALLLERGRPCHVVPLTLATLKDVYTRCKLYDYERHQWVDFDGTPTSAVLVPPRRADASSMPAASAAEAATA
jgi:omega-6 fatty acid desaturase (delta-12 desaturase)